MGNNSRYFDAPQVVKIEVKDNAGNKTDAKVKLNIDRIAPSVETFNDDDSDNVIIKATDAESGIVSVKAVDFPINQIEVLIENSEEDDNTYIAKVKAKPGQFYVGNLKFEVKDKAGNTTYKVTDKRVSSDQQAPSIKDISFEKLSENT